MLEISPIILALCFFQPPLCLKLYQHNRLKPSGYLWTSEAGGLMGAIPQSVKMTLNAIIKVFYINTWESLVFHEVVRKAPKFTIAHIMNSDVFHEGYSLGTRQRMLGYICISPPQNLCIWVLCMILLQYSNNWLIELL